MSSQSDIRDSATARSTGSCEQRGRRSGAVSEPRLELRLRRGPDGRRRRLRFLTIIDEFTRESIWIETARFLNSNDIVRVLECLVETRGIPGVIKSDNGPELVCKRVQGWIKKRGS